MISHEILRRPSFSHVQLLVVIETTLAKLVCK